MHASAEEKARGTLGHLLPVERAPPAAPPLHGQKLQCGVAARRFVLLHPAAALAGRLRAGAGSVRAGRAAEGKPLFQDFGAGRSEEGLKNGNGNGSVRNGSSLTFDTNRY